MRVDSAAFCLRPISRLADPDCLASDEGTYPLRLGDNAINGTLVRFLEKRKRDRQALSLISEVLFKLAI